MKDLEFHTIDLTPEQALRLHLIDLLVPMRGDRHMSCVLAEAHYLYNNVMSVQDRVRFKLLAETDTPEPRVSKNPQHLDAPKHLQHLTPYQVRYLRMVEQVLDGRNGRDIEVVRKDADNMYHAILQFSPEGIQAVQVARDQQELRRFCGTDQSAVQVAPDQQAEKKK